MKKILALLLLIPSVSFGAVTQAQVDQAKATNQQMFSCYIAMNTYLNGVDYLLKSGFKVTVPGSTTTVTIPQSLQDEAVDVPRYQAKKACYPAAFGTFP